MAKKMIVIPTRAGIIFECQNCKLTLLPEQADAHECLVVFAL